VTFDLEEDADCASVFKLLGNLLYADSNYNKNELGIDTPVRLEIERFDVGEKRAEADTEDVYEYTGIYR
jgi:hypothetical protein